MFDHMEKKMKRRFAPCLIARFALVTSFFFLRRICRVGAAKRMRVPPRFAPMDFGENTQDVFFLRHSRGTRLSRGTVY
jgi:hypothetical protein